MGVWCDAQLEGQMLFWDGKSRLSDGRTGKARGWSGMVLGLEVPLLVLE